ncbi:aspartate 1-decarboxylase [Saccharopolyspora sp. NPDC000359]|uniref:aspartate 1-decarboxylase n=1 Tax=Saccharopolyspora sp. NPDC000359 TaxID=3154251 RepID=UPI003324E8DA
MSSDVMYREVLKSKIHRATVTQSDLHYVGSITIDQALVEAADLVAGEKVDVVDVTNGARLTTYVIEGPRDSGVIGINGAAAHLVKPGDLVIIISYASVPDAVARTFQPHIVFADEQNRIARVGGDPLDVPTGSGLVRGDLVHPE